MQSIEITEIDSIVVCLGLEAGGMGSWCCVGAEIEFHTMRRAREMDGGNGCPGLQIYL